MLADELAVPALVRVSGGAAVAAHHGAEERQRLDRPDERLPFEEQPVLPEQPVELGGVEGPEAAEEDELLGRRDRRDRVELEEAQPADRVEHAGRRAVEQLRAHRDAAGGLVVDARVAAVPR